jgi:hypothetical protein
VVLLDPAADGVVVGDRGRAANLFHGHTPEADGFARAWKGPQEILGQMESLFARPRLNSGKDLVIFRGWVWRHAFLLESGVFGSSPHCFGRNHHVVLRGNDQFTK